MAKKKDEFDLEPALQQIEAEPELAVKVQKPKGKKKSPGLMIGSKFEEHPKFAKFKKGEN